MITCNKEKQKKESKIKQDDKEKNILKLSKNHLAQTKNGN